MEYSDNKELMEDQIGRIIFDMAVVANKHYAMGKLKEREGKRAQDERERQRRLEQVRKGELAEIKAMQQAVSDWDMAEKIRAFTDRLEGNVSEVLDDEKRAKLFSWLKWARDKADWLDPLTEKEDEILGKSKFILQIIEEEYGKF